MDKIKKFSSIISIIFLISIVFILGAKKFNWPVNNTFVRIFIVILVLTLLCILIVSISEMRKTISKQGIKKFSKKLILNWALYFVILYAVAFFKKHVDILAILGSSLLFSILSYYSIGKETT
ncbi:hypothetical protein [Haloimpatiens lingqiaonensis]|uniref:hypothetical protein n=1 Tax=Haloimpatiens lingqiaonensis TaxID=1380675 RepID=UPI0010FF4C52|nr:hypothetical protein [Haloimpatiens lingqiaonensis]